MDMNLGGGGRFLIPQGPWSSVGPRGCSPPPHRPLPGEGHASWAHGPWAAASPGLAVARSQLALTWVPTAALLQGFP